MVRLVTWAASHRLVRPVSRWNLWQNHSTAFRMPASRYVIARRSTVSASATARVYSAAARTSGVNPMLNRRSAACLVIAYLVGGAVAPVLSGATPNKQSDVVRTSRGELRLTPLYHGSVMLEFGGKVVHVDPWSQTDYAGLPPADLIVVTHTHADHLDRMA